MYVAVSEVNPQNDYTLFLTFKNGEKKRFDMNPYLNLGLFKELKDIDKFKTVRVVFDAIEWDNELDFDPEVLYQKGEPM